MQFFKIYSDIPLTLIYGQGHQTWHQLLDPKQGHNHAKLDRLPLNSIHQKANMKVFVKSENTSLYYVQLKSKKYWCVHYILDLLNNPTKFQFNGITTQNFQLKLFDIAVTLKYVKGN